MPKFSKISLERLETCHPDLQTLMHEVVKHLDISIFKGHRGQVEQDKAYADGKSQLRWPHGNHNASPSNAVDVSPYPTPKGKEEQRAFYFMGGYIMGIAEKLLAEGKLTHRIRWGGDWNQNHNFSDQTFFDLYHFEITNAG